MSKEEKTPYLMVNENGDTFTIYVKGTKPYLDLQQRIDKAIEYIKNGQHWLCRVNEDKTIEAVSINELLELLGDKENE